MSSYKITAFQRRTIIGVSVYRHRHRALACSRTDSLPPPTDTFINKKKKINKDTVIHCVKLLFTLLDSICKKFHCHKILPHHRLSLKHSCMICGFQTTLDFARMNQPSLIVMKATVRNSKKRFCILAI
jgi:hypothetical protein